MPSAITATAGRVRFTWPLLLPFALDHVDPDGGSPCCLVEHRLGRLEPFVRHQLPARADRRHGMVKRRVKVRLLLVQEECDERDGTASSAAAVDENVSAVPERIGGPLRHRLAKRTVEYVIGSQNHGVWAALVIDHADLVVAYCREPGRPALAIRLVGRHLDIVDVEVDGTIDDGGDAVSSQKPQVARAFAAADVESGAVRPQSLGNQADGRSGMDRCIHAVSFSRPRRVSLQDDRPVPRAGQAGAICRSAGIAHAAKGMFEARLVSDARPGATARAGPPASRLPISRYGQTTPPASLTSSRPARQSQEFMCSQYSRPSGHQRRKRAPMRRNRRGEHWRPCRARFHDAEIGRVRNGIDQPISSDAASKRIV